MPRLLLVDGHSNLYRAFYAGRPLVRIWPAGTVPAGSSSGWRREAGRPDAPGAGSPPVSGRLRRIAIDTVPLRQPAYRRLLGGLGAAAGAERAGRARHQDPERQGALSGRNETQARA